jgi:hypothetical protein
MNLLDNISPAASHNGAILPVIFYEVRSVKSDLLRLEKSDMKPWTEVGTGTGTICPDRRVKISSLIDRYTPHGSYIK